MYTVLRLLFLSALIHASSLYAQPEIRLVVPDFKPYTYEENNEIVGYGVSTVLKILDKMTVPYTLSIVPNYGRALAELSHDRADALFLASQNEERNRVARFYGPIVINRWIWFVNSDDHGLTPDSDHFKEQARIATLLNTNTHRWLETHDYKVTFAGSDVAQLIDLLSNGRVDAVLIAELVFKDALRLRGAKAEFREYIHSERDFGIYFSKRFLRLNEGFLEQFDTTMKQLN